MNEKLSITTAESARPLTAAGSSPRSAERTNGRRRRRRTRLVAMVGAPLVLTAALVGGTASSASAATTQDLAPLTIGVFPSWFAWGTTTMCVTSLSPHPGSVQVTVLFPTAPALNGERIRTTGYGTTCIRRQWGGAPVIANNVGAGWVRVTTY